MKKLLLLAACALLALPLHAETKLMEEFIPGFVYLQQTDGPRKTDIYLNPSQIVAVSLLDSQTSNFRVEVITTASAPNTTGMRYVLDFPDKAKAKECVNQILVWIRQATAGGKN